MGLSDNPLFKRAAKRGDNGHGDLSEKRVVKSLGGRAQPNSGAMRGAKGDARLERRHKYRIECKSTTKPTMAVELGWLVKITEEALPHGEVPTLTISFVTPEGKARKNGDWVMVPKNYFDELSSE